MPTDFGLEYRRMTMQRFLLLVTYFVGMASLVLAGIIGYEGFREARRLNAEIVSLKAEIAQMSGPTANAQPQADSELNTGDSEIAALKNRIAILEEAWRSQSVSPGPSTLPPLQPETSADTAPSGENCIPEGTRFLATVGESFDICSTDAKVQLSAIGPTDIVLSTGGTAPIGGQAAIEGTNCTVSALTADAANGFAELRVTCG